MKLDITYEHFSKSFHDEFREENIKLKDFIKKSEKEALDEVRGSAFESNCDFQNFVKIKK